MWVIIWGVLSLWGILTQWFIGGVLFWGVLCPWGRFVTGTGVRIKWLESEKKGGKEEKDRHL